MFKKLWKNITRKREDKKISDDIINEAIMHHNNVLSAFASVREQNDKDKIWLESTKKEIEDNGHKWCVFDENDRSMFIGSDGRRMTFDEMMDSSEYTIIF